ncbi:putative membrane protein [Lachnospiraceae bacterium PF1-21]
MSRIEFMNELAALLADLPIDDRNDALAYYNDYFDAAGAENEGAIISELVSPAKVAKTIKSELGGTIKEDQESSDVLPEKYEEMPKDKNNLLKIILIIAGVCILAPIILPIIFAVFITVVSLLFAVFMFFVSLVIAAVAVIICGISLIVAGILMIIPEIAAGLVCIGVGLLLTAAGLVATRYTVKLCTVVFPGLVRFTVDICRRLVGMTRKAVA